jgi:caspase 7
MDKGTLMQCDSAKERDSVVEENSIPTLADFMIAYYTVTGND